MIEADGDDGYCAEAYVYCWRFSAVPARRSERPECADERTYCWPGDAGQSSVQRTMSAVVQDVFLSIKKDLSLPRLAEAARTRQDSRFGAFRYQGGRIARLRRPDSSRRALRRYASRPARPFFRSQWPEESIGVHAHPRDLRAALANRNDFPVRFWRCAVTRPFIHKLTALVE